MSLNAHDYARRADFQAGPGAMTSPTTAGHQDMHHYGQVQNRQVSHGSSQNGLGAAGYSDSYFSTSGQQTYGESLPPQSYGGVQAPADQSQETNGSPHGPFGPSLVSRRPVLDEVANGYSDQAQGSMRPLPANGQGQMFPPQGRPPVHGPPLSRFAAPGGQYDLGRPDFARHQSSQSIHSHMSAPSISSQQSYDFVQEPVGRTFDTTGQSCPPGGRPRVSTTIWEDEGTLCFQIEARQVTVARREDNDMINGTKLLNVAGMSRGKRDGILKNEPIRTVIKIGSMHLKGVWIPFDRALDLANRHAITDLLYPLFVKDIKKFLYHPANYARTAAVLAAATQRQALQGGGPSIPGADVNMMEERPMLDRSISMPTPLDKPLSMLTPPSSASTSGIAPPIEHWQNSPGVPISDTQIRSHSLPGTPATTPPGAFPHGAHMQQPYLNAAFTEPRAPAGAMAARYGHQPDMQRLYSNTHSRNTSIMSYQEEDMQNANGTDHAVNNGLRIHSEARVPGHRSNLSLTSLPSANATIRSNDPAQPFDPGFVPSFDQGSTHPRQPQLVRTHSRSRSSQMFNTPNLTQQMSRRHERTPGRSPTRHSRQSSREQAMNPTAAWAMSQQRQQHVQPPAAQVQQTLEQDMSYNYGTPQHQHQAGRLGAVGSAMPPASSGQLSQIYEETPSCRLAYQLHAQRGGNAQPPAFGGQQVAHHGVAVPSHIGHELNGQMASPTGNGHGQVNDAQAHPEFAGLASPLTGKKKRERLQPGFDEYAPQDVGTSVHASPAMSGKPGQGYLAGPLTFDRHDDSMAHQVANNMGTYRDESVTPPPLQTINEETPSHKRRRSIMHTPHAAPLTAFGAMS